MNKQRQHRMQVRHMQRRLGEEMNARRYSGNTPEKDARLDKGQLADAAAVLLRYAADREKLRNLPKAVEIHNDYKKGNYTDLEQAGYHDMQQEPPANWPLTAEEWPNYNQIQVLEQAMALIAHELERLRNQHTDLYRHGHIALDLDQLDQLKKNQEVQRRKSKRAWKLCSQAADSEKVDTASGGLQLAAATPVTITATYELDDLMMDEGPFPGGEGG